jgi:HAD superfamily hydrolase (TIGR01549 family)
MENNKVNLHQLKGVIFDLDGVIFDIISSVEQSVEDAINKYKLKNENIEEGLQEIAHLIEDLQNYPIPQIILNSYNLLQISLLEGHRLIKKLRIAVYVFNQFNLYKEEAVLFEGIDELIKSLHSQHKKLAILTNNKNTHAEEVLKKFEIDKYFDILVGFNEVSEVKPSPEGILKILNTWKVKDSEVIFIGDMVTDILAGQAANVKTISVASGLAKKESLLAKNPDYLVNNTEELKKLFE